MSVGTHATPQSRRGSWLLLVAAGCAFVAAAVIPAGAAGNGANGNGGSPSGSNATIKVDGVGDTDSGNDPHVTSPFQLSLWGFDAGTDTASVAFTAQPPSGPQGQAVPITSGPATFAFVGSGDKHVFDVAKTYTLDTSGLKVQPQQGVHLVVTVVVTPGSNGALPVIGGRKPAARQLAAAGGNGKGKGNGANNGNGGGNGNAGGNGNGKAISHTTKFKVFWLTPAAVIPPPPPPIPPIPPVVPGNPAPSSTPTPTPTVSPTGPTPPPSVTPTVLGVRVTRQLPPPAQVRGVQVQRLPFTGAPTARLVLLAGGALLLGAGLLRSATPRRR